MLESPAVSQCQESFVTSAAVGGADSLTAYSLSVSDCQKNDDYNHICGVIQNYLARHSKSSVADCQIQNEICKWNKCTAADVVATSHQSDSPFVPFCGSNRGRPGRISISSTNMTNGLGGLRVSVGGH